MEWLFGDILAARVRTAAVSVRIDDSPGWDPLSAGYGPADRPWGERRDDLDDALEAWRRNFFVRRVVSLVRSYVVGNGITISSRKPTIDRFLRQFWSHPKNRLPRRLGAMCDELTRAGELFPVLFTNKVDGMSYVRFVPASRIRDVETDPDDYEKELRYSQIQYSAEPRWWLSPDHPDANLPPGSGGSGGVDLPPIMLHFAVNRPIGATRGEGDVLPILPWARRYSEWLKDRVRLNRIRTRQGMLDLEIADDTMVEEKRRQVRTDNPWEYGIYVHGPGETMNLHNLNIGADDAEKDGRVLRLAVASGANMALHYLGEGEATNYATAKEMGEPTARFFTDRQTDLRRMLEDLVTHAYRRKVALGLARWPARGDLQLETAAPEVARADNQSLALAARQIVMALELMRQYGWVDDKTAVSLAFKFAGEPLGEEEITRILQTPPIEEAEHAPDPQLQPG